MAVERMFGKYTRGRRTPRSLSSPEKVEGATVPAAKLEFKAVVTKTGGPVQPWEQAYGPVAPNGPRSRPLRAVNVTEEAGAQDAVGRLPGTRCGPAGGSAGWSLAQDVQTAGLRVPVRTQAAVAGWIPRRSTYERHRMFLSLPPPLPCF